VEYIRVWIEGFLRGRYGYEGDRGLWVVVTPALVGAILVAGWLLLSPLTIPRFSTEGPVVRNGVAVVVTCGEKRGIEKGLMAAAKYAPKSSTGTWTHVKKGECRVWYHRPYSRWGGNTRF
jgi:hypothetical protein